MMAEYDGYALSDKSCFSTSELEAALHKRSLGHYQKIIVSSVVPQYDHFFDSYPVTFVSVDNIPFLKVNLKCPQEVGADRLVTALGAYQTYGGPCLVVDSGTAVTFCYVDEEGVYQGGSIFPGMLISSRALNDYTAKIPLIYVTKQSALYGKTN